MVKEPYPLTISQNFTFGGYRANTTVCEMVFPQNLPHPPKVSFETSFDSKQPKLEPKLVSALSETKHLFRLFRFYNETESFNVSIEPKQTEDQPKQFDREHILLFVYRKFRLFPLFSFFRFVLKQFVLVVSLLYQNREFQCFD